MNDILYNPAKLNLMFFTQEMLEKNPSGQERLPTEIMPSVLPAQQTVPLPNMVGKLFSVYFSFPTPFFPQVIISLGSVYRLINIFF